MPLREPTEYQTDLRRSSLAVVIGVLANAIAFLIERRVLVVIGAEPAFNNDLSTLAVMALLTLAVTLLVTPFWRLAHRRGLRQWWWALGMGIVAALAAFALVLGLSVRYSSPSLPQMALVLAQVSGCGVVTSLVTWRIAYRRTIAADVAVF